MYYSYSVTLVSKLFNICLYFAELEILLKRSCILAINHFINKGFPSLVVFYDMKYTVMSLALELCSIIIPYVSPG